MPTSKAISASKFFGKDRYEHYLNELLTENTLGGQQLSKAQIKEAFSKRKNRISFEQFVDKVISTKTARAVAFPGTGPVLGPAGGGLGPKGGALVKSPIGALTTYKKLQVSEDKKEIGGISEYLKDITNSLGNIIKILNQGISADIKTQQKNKRDKERSKRDALEKGLEKGFSAVSKIVDKVVAPVKSILSRIIDFFIKMFLARAIVKLINWLADPQNQDKVKSLIRFFGDHWGKLLSLYIVFGTSFGKFARGLISLVIRSTIRLGAAAAGLAVKAGIGKAGGKLAKVAGFLGGPKGKLLAAGLETAAVVGGTMALSKTIDGGEQKAQGFAGGGYVRPKFPAFAGGGLNFKGMLGGASLGSMFGPLGMLLGGALGGSGKPQEMFGGFVSGEKGVDKVPAMLSDGEFVMSRGAVAKYGVDTLEAMNAAGGGTNKPKIMSGTTFAQGGGLIGDMPIAYSYGQNPHVDTMRRAARLFEKTGFGTEDELFKAFKKLGYIPDIQKMVGGDNFLRISQGHHGADDALDAIRQSVADKLKAVNNPQSFTQSSRAAAGLDDLAKKFDMDAKTAPRYGENLPRLGRPKAKITRIDPSRMLPAAGESSANAMRAAAKAAQNVRQPIPASRAIVPYGGGGLARTGVTAGLSAPQIQQIRTNMNVPTPGTSLSKNVRPRGYGGALQAAFAAMEFNERKREGQTTSQAGLGAAGSAFGGQVGWMGGAKAGALIGGGIGAMFGGVGAAPGAAIGAIIGGVAGGFGGAALGGKLADDVSGVNAAKERMSRGGIGGAIKGGYKLKEQSFKDAPKTQVMTDDKGRPFVGYKAMRGGKLVYVRGSQPGTGTSNPLEMLGRAINPGAYKENDQRLSMQKQKVAMVNSLESLQARGASVETQKKMMKQMGGNLKDVQNDLTYRKKQAQVVKPKATSRTPVKPPVKPKTNVIRVAGGGMNGGRGSAAASRRRQSVPAVSPAHPQGTRRNQAVLGIKSR